MGIPKGHVQVNVALPDAEAERFDAQVKDRGFVKQRASQAALRLWMDLPVEVQARLISQQLNANLLVELVQQALEQRIEAGDRAGEKLVSRQKRKPIRRG